MKHKSIVLSIVGGFLLALCTISILLIGIAGWLLSRPAGQEQREQTSVPTASIIVQAATPTPLPPPIPIATPTPMPTPMQRDSPLWGAGGGEVMLIPAITPSPPPQITPPPTPPEGGEKSPPTPIIARPGVATRLAIPRLGLDTPVLFAPLENQTWRVSHLGQLVGHLEGTASPGSNSNMVLAGHVTLAAGVYGPFANLNQLAPGDVVLVYENDKVFQYVISGSQTVTKTDVEVVYPSEAGEITLITCSNWNSAESRYSHRLVVKGYLIAN